MKCIKVINISVTYILLVGILFGCTGSNCFPAVQSREDSINTILGECTLVQESDFFRIVKCDSMYYCVFFDQFHNVVRTEGPVAKMPTVDMVNGELICFIFQAGTGRGTQWGYYYHVDCNQFSDVFYGICDRWENNVIYIDIDKVVIRDIFDQSKYYREFSQFSKPLSNAAEPIVNAEFINNGRQIRITYLTGVEFIEISEIFGL